MSNPELLDRSQADQALRDLMPVVEWLLKALLPSRSNHCSGAIQAFRRIPDGSPAIKAYIRWLKEDHSAEFEKG